MVKINWNRKNIFIIVYSIFILIIAEIIILANMTSYLNNTEILVETEISKINTAEIREGENIGNYKVEILKNDQSSYYIKVNCKEQIVTIYLEDKNSENDIIVKNMICSTGIATPNEGVFEISDKYEWRYLVGNVYGQYATRITGQILFHSVPYTKQDKSSLEYWEYDKLGQPVSKGCVRLTVEDAKWIYDNCKKGTKVEFCTEEVDQSDTNDIKKSILKLSSYDEELRNWDPTDPDVNNPWLQYKDLVVDMDI